MRGRGAHRRVWCCIYIKTQLNPLITLNIYIKIGYLLLKFLLLDLKPDYLLFSKSEINYLKLEHVIKY